ncbi:MAG: 16S rRNA (guanine(966)-N(2))-methyltransferase RsmD [Candidatus Aminicenantes bacterium]|nr:MAG: 16S rRNA (guanine(966)-N(2))-methyltransferase RsmD [Candidatus Aminicenantes bacterium]
MIRIISGIHKGKRLKNVSSPLVRPVPDKLKEALFNIIQEKIKNCIFLDGFAGTGSVGIEALSRGAKRAVFIDEYYPAIKVIKINLEKCDALDKAQVIRKEFNRAIIQLSREGAKFDLSFLDPPYKLIEERDPLKVIKKREILKPKGLIILRHYYKTRFEPKYFSLKRRVTIGDDSLSFYELNK